MNEPRAWLGRRAKLRGGHRKEVELPERESTPGAAAGGLPFSGADYGFRRSTALFDVAGCSDRHDGNHRKWPHIVDEPAEAGGLEIDTLDHLDRIAQRIRERV